MRTLRHAAIGLALGLSALPATAADGQDRQPAIFWLMDEPVTLFDLGLLRLKGDLERTSRWLSSKGFADEPPVSGSYYEWRSRRIIAYVSLRETTREPSERRCREVFGHVVRHITVGIPQGSGTAATYLENLFLHAGPGNIGRPRNLGEELAETVQLEITLLPPAPISLGGNAVRCVGGFGTDPSEVDLVSTQ